MKSTAQLILLAGVATQIQETTALSKDGKCRILSLRGGGIHGSWEAGVLQGLVQNMPEDEIEYDYVAGVSIGAINASILATFPKGDEKEAVDLLTSLYETYTTSELFEFYSPWWIAPFTHSSFADNSKLM